MPMSAFSSDADRAIARRRRRRRGARDDQQAREMQVTVRYIVKGRRRFGFSSPSSSSADGQEQEQQVFLPPVDFSTTLSDLSTVQRSKAFVVGALPYICIPRRSIQAIDKDRLAGDLHRAAMDHFWRGLPATTIPLTINIGPIPRMSESATLEMIRRCRRRERAREANFLQDQGGQIGAADFLQDQGGQIGAADFLQDRGGQIGAADFQVRVAYTPATEDQISRSLRSNTLRKGEGMGCSSCAICQEEFFEEEDGEGADAIQVKQMPCLHLFHDHCIVNWLRRSNFCPICRYKIPNDDSAD